VGQQFASRSVEKSGDDAPGETPVEESDGLDALLEALEDREWKVRWDAVNALGNAKDRRATPALVERALRDDNPHPRWRSLWAISAVDPDGRDAIPLLRAGLDDPDAVVVRNAAVALAFVAQPESRPELLKALEDPDVFRRWEAVFSLKTIGDEQVVRALIPLLNESIEPAVRVRQETALTLGRIGNAEAVAALLGSLREDQSPQVRWRAAMALSQIGDSRLAYTLERVLVNEQDPQVRKFVEDAVRSLRSQ
jgi:HEAT repeat protein